MLRNGLVSALVLLLAACSGNLKPPPPPLVDFKPTRTVAPVWVAPTGERLKTQHAQLLPTLADGVIYVAHGSGELAALVSGTGALRWRQVLGAPLSTAPGVGEGVVAVGTTDAQVLVLQSSDGRVLWRASVSSEVLGQPLVAAGLLVAQTVDGKVYAFKVADGQRMWVYEQRVPPLTLRGTSAPVLFEDRIIVGFASGQLVALSLRAGEPYWETGVATPRGRNDLERMVDVDGQFRVVDGVVYAVAYQGRVVAISIDSGAVVWARDMSSATGVEVAGTQVYLSDAAGVVWALDRASGATLWRQEALMGREVTLPAVLKDTVAVADRGGYVHWMATEDGRLVGRAKLDDAYVRAGWYWWFADGDRPAPRDTAVTSAPVATAEYLYVRDNDGALTAYYVAPLAGSPPK